MPIHHCEEDGKPGFQWGGHGKCYTYDPSSAKSKASARLRAEMQAAAAHASGFKEGGSEGTKKIT